MSPKEKRAAGTVWFNVAGQFNGALLQRWNLLLNL